MAFNLRRSGDRFLKAQGISAVPKGYGANYLAAWAVTALQTVPAVGDLVKQDTSGDDLVQQCVASDVPYGIVDSVNSGNGTLTVVKFNKTFSLILESNNSPTRGHSVQANGTVGTIKIDGVLRNQVKDVAFAAGSGLITAFTAVGSVWLVYVEYPN